MIVLDIITNNSGSSSLLQSDSLAMDFPAPSSCAGSEVPTASFLSQSHTVCVTVGTGTQMIQTCPKSGAEETEQWVVIPQCGCKECAGPALPLWGGFWGKNQRRRQKLFSSACSSVAQPIQLLGFYTSLQWAEGELLSCFHLFLLGVLKNNSKGAHSLFFPSAPPSPPAREAPQGEKSQRTHFSAVAWGLFHTQGQDRNVQQSGAIWLGCFQGCSAPHRRDHLEGRRRQSRARLCSQGFRRWHSRV